MDNRALIFANLLNGVPAGQVARDFGKTEPEVMSVFSSVLRMIKSHCFIGARGYVKKGDTTKQTHAYPIIVASTVEEARKFRLTCLTVLPKLSLDKAPQYKDIQGEIVTPDNVMSIARNIKA